MITLDLAHLCGPDAEGKATAKHHLLSVSSAVIESRKVIVVSGAGISCSAGIPDFRSSNGLYNLVKTRYPSTVVTGRDLFSSSLFRSAESTSVFYTFIAELKDIASRAHPTSTHQFIKKLDTTGRLLRSYTQNIDGLEKQAGLVCSSTVDGQSVRLKSTEATPSEPQPRPVKMEQTEAMSVPSYTSTGTFDKKRTKNVQLHGDLHRLRCNLCSGSYDFTDEYVKICREGLAPVCPACEIRDQDRRDRDKRPLKPGSLRPAIILYGENHPDGDHIGSLQLQDLNQAPDLLLVLGTSLQVEGLKLLVRELARTVHSLPGTQNRREGGRGRAIFVNKTEPPGAGWKAVFDYWVKGDCDEWVANVEDQWKQQRPSEWETLSTPDGASEPGPSRHLPARRSGTAQPTVQRYRSNLPSEQARHGKSPSPSTRLERPVLERSETNQNTQTARKTYTAVSGSKSLAKESERGRFSEEDGMITVPPLPILPSKTKPACPTVPGLVSGQAPGKPCFQPTGEKTCGTSTCTEASPVTASTRTPPIPVEAGTSQTRPLAHDGDTSGHAQRAPNFSVTIVADPKTTWTQREQSGEPSWPSVLAPVSFVAALAEPNASAASDRAPTSVAPTLSFRTKGKPPRKIPRPVKAASIVAQKQQAIEGAQAPRPAATVAGEVEGPTSSASAHLVRPGPQVALGSSVMEVDV